jgi:hypothetical protein
MLRIRRRIEKLERRSPARFPYLEHTIRFVDGDGTVSGSLLIAPGRVEWIDCETPEEKRKKAQ